MEQETEKRFEILEKKVEDCESMAQILKQIAHDALFMMSIQCLFMFTKLDKEYMLLVIGLTTVIFMVIIFIRLMYVERHK